MSFKLTTQSTLLLYFFLPGRQRLQCHPILTVLTFLRCFSTDQEKKLFPKIKSLQSGAEELNLTDFITAGSWPTECIHLSFSVTDEWSDKHMTSGGSLYNVFHNFLLSLPPPPLKN